MTMKLSPYEAAQAANISYVDSPMVEQGESIWSVSEKKYTRFLRKKRERPSQDDVDPRVMDVEKKKIGLLYGKNRERLKRVEAKYEVEIKQLEEREGQVFLKVVGGSELDLPLVKQEFQYVKEEIPVDGFDPTWLKQHNSILKEIAKSTKASVSLRNLGLEDSGASNNSADKKMNGRDSNPMPSPRGEKFEVESTAPVILIRGPRPAVNLARDALDVHFSYYTISQEMTFLERELEQCKVALQKEIAVV